jgi:hypothetical protein
MRRTALLVPVLAAVLGVTACGGSSAPQGSEDAPSPAPTSTATPAPEALTGFSCVPGADGLWVATGSLTNATDAATTYTVDVYVGPADGQERPANRTEYPDVQPGGSTAVQIGGIAAQGEPATCHVRVLTTVTAGDDEE